MKFVFSYIRWLIIAVGLPLIAGQAMAVHFDEAFTDVFVEAYKKNQQQQKKDVQIDDNDLKELGNLVTNNLNIFYKNKDAVFLPDETQQSVSESDHVEFYQLAYGALFNKESQGDVMLYSYVPEEILKRNFVPPAFRIGFVNALGSEPVLKIFSEKFTKEGLDFRVPGEGKRISGWDVYNSHAAMVMSGFFNCPKTPKMLLCADGIKRENPIKQVKNEAPAGEVKQYLGSLLHKYICNRKDETGSNVFSVTTKTSDCLIQSFKNLDSNAFSELQLTVPDSLEDATKMVKRLCDLIDDDSDGDSKPFQGNIGEQKLRALVGFGKWKPLQGELETDDETIKKELDKKKVLAFCYARLQPVVTVMLMECDYPGTDDWGKYKSSVTRQNWVTGQPGAEKAVKLFTLTGNSYNPYIVWKHGADNFDKKLDEIENETKSEDMDTK
ncbi:hypothetical protein CI610_03143 [invertebrate metagenome]|uniref:Uncharacterized protein n=1 Tax=invertebrate metagenome TaxID=1711999 RepID=A0A2H9T3Z3_9ZZZZ